MAFVFNAFFFYLQFQVSVNEKRPLLISTTPILSVLPNSSCCVIFYMWLIWRFVSYNQKIWNVSIVKNPLFYLNMMKFDLKTSWNWYFRFIYFRYLFVLKVTQRVVLRVHQIPLKWFSSYTNLLNNFSQTWDLEIMAVADRWSM